MSLDIDDSLIASNAISHIVPTRLGTFTEWAGRSVGFQQEGCVACATHELKMRNSVTKMTYVFIQFFNYGYIELKIRGYIELLSGVFITMVTLN